MARRVVLVFYSDYWIARDLLLYLHGAKSERFQNDGDS